MFAYLKHQLISRRGFAHRLWLLGFALFLVSGSLQAAQPNSVTLAWDASTAANVGGYKVYYGQGSRNYTSSVDVGNATSYSVTGLQAGATYYFAVSVYDSTRNFESRYSAETTATIPTPSTGLVAAYGFDEANGAYVQDASGSGNYGGIAGAVRTTEGYFGNALKFDGVNDWISIPNSPSLALAAGMTLEAWVYPTTWMSGLSTVVMKEQPATSTSAGTETYLLAANNSTNQPMSAVRTGSEVAVGGNTQVLPNQWTHLATTYDGQYQSLYVNGVLVSMIAQTGAITPSTGSLKIGGNCIWGGFFQGYIDEVRIYNRALSNAEIINDSKTAISSSNPLKFVIGDQNVESTVVSLPSGTAQAFKITPQRSQQLTNVQVYQEARCAPGLRNVQTTGRISGGLCRLYQEGNSRYCRRRCRAPAPRGYHVPWHNL